MATAKEFITVPLRKLNAVGRNRPLQQEAADEALLELNDMMSELAASGVPTGFTKITNLAAEVTIPEPMNAAIKNQLTVRLKTYYPKAELDAAFVKSVNESWTNLLIQGDQPTVLTMFPDDTTTETVTEQNDVIVVEDGT